MFGFTKRDEPPAEEPAGPGVDTRLCTHTYNGKYPTVGLFDCRNRKVWICKPLGGQAIRTSHARLITGSDNATSTARKDRFLCFWFYTPRTGEGYIHGYPIDWEEAHLLVRTDPNWDYERGLLVPPHLEDHVNENLERQFRHGERVAEFLAGRGLKFPFSLHFIGLRAADSQFYVKRIEPRG